MSSDSKVISIRQPFINSALSKKRDWKSEEEQIIDGCIAGERRIQKLLYDRYSPTMLGICMRYSKSQDEAQDIMQDGFVKVFTNIDTFRKQGSFEGWIKRIMVNTALNHYHKNQKNMHQNIDDIRENKILDDSVPEQKLPYTQMEMLQAIRSLPEGYSIVFNLYVFEKFKHREIAEQLNISVNTSKSQLSKARIYLQKSLARIKEQRNKR
jgi:RNA polymerase sigma-70 factor (ECF subfamily)